MKNRKGTYAKEENGSSVNSILHLSGGNSCVNASGPAIGWHKDI
jgi:hypothetical protein